MAPRAARSRHEHGHFGSALERPDHALLTAAREDPNILRYSSPRQLAELADVLGRRKLGAAVSAGGESPDALLQRYLSAVTTVVPAPITPVAIADPDDDHVLACAVAAGADLLIVSGDSDLLDPKAYQGIPLVTAAEALTRQPRQP